MPPKRPWNDDAFQSDTDSVAQVLAPKRLHRSVRVTHAHTSTYQEESDILEVQDQSEDSNGNDSL